MVFAWAVAGGVLALVVGSDCEEDPYAGAGEYSRVVGEQSTGSGRHYPMSILGHNLEERLGRMAESALGGVHEADVAVDYQFLYVHFL